MNQQINYNSYTSDDFLADDHFIRWIKYKAPEDGEVWTQWRKTNPANLAEFEKAAMTLQLFLSAERIAPGAEDAESIWQKIEVTLDNQPKVVPFYKNRKTWLIAASIAAIALVTAATWLIATYNPTNTIVAEYGQQKKVGLPDASVVLLNANSELKYLAKWNDGRARTVYLKGEAFFDVKNIIKDPQTVAQEEGFTVLTEMLEVNVLGTTFNIKERRGVTSVALESGSLKVKVRNDTSSQLLLQPGDLAEYVHLSQQLKKVTTNPVFHKDWTEKKILTNNTTVAEILQEIEDIYGYTIILQDKTIANRRLDGPIPMDSENNVLFVLSNILDVDIIKQDRKLVFKNRK